MAPRTGLENERSELGIAQQYHSDIVQHSPKAKLTVMRSTDKSFEENKWCTGEGFALRRRVSHSESSPPELAAPTYGLEPQLLATATHCIRVAYIGRRGDGT